MKKFNFLFLLLITSVGLYAQRINSDESTGVIIASEFHVTRPIREIFAENPIDETKYFKQESGDRKHRIPQKFEFSANDGPEYSNDRKTIQDKMGTEPNRAPLTNWAGQSATGFRPMDPSGAAGPNHYIQMINSTTFKIYNKTTGANMLTGSFGNLWSPATPNDGDPIVLYDKAADRWFMSQFGSSGNKIYIAISQTADPTGAYYTYTFSSPLFPDYLKFSVWSDGYYMTSNQSTQRVFSFNRAELLAGNPAARSIYTNFSPPDGTGFFCPLPADAADGSLPPAGTPCPILSYSDNNWGAGYNDAINIYQMAVNWVPTTPTATITLKANVATAAFDATYNPSWDDVSQPGTSQKLDGIGGVLMYRAQWKSWSGYNTIVLNWGVLISASQRSIKWCELRQDQTTTNWSIYQEGIYTPDAATRWMGSIAMDNNGSIGLSYMKSDATSIFPGIYYSGRKSCDALGTLPITESLVIAGSGSQSGTNRVGDYAHTTLDPDGITFWHTSEYIGSGGAAKTQIFSYQLPSCGNIASVSISQTTGANPQCSGATATFTATPFNGGTTPVYQWQVNGSNVGTNSTTYSTTSLTNGQIVKCIMTSNLPGVTGNPATSNVITMSIYSTPAAAGSIAGSTVVCKGQTGVVYTVSSIANATGYSWTLPSGASITSGTNTNSITVTFSASAISGNISVFGTNPGCNGTSSLLGISIVTPIATSGNQTLTNSAGVVINDVTTASPYPSSITFSGLTGLTQDVNVTITGLTHTYPDDIDIILESPTGQRVTLISDCGLSGSLTGVNLTFDDAAASNLPDGTGIVTGTFKPTNFTSPDTYASPGPGSFAGPTGASSTALTAFNGFSPNGTWRLFIVDDVGGDIGTITSWSITVVVPFSAYTISGNSSVCTGQSGVSYSIPAVANATGYNWVLPSGATIASGANTNSITVNYSGSAVSGNISVTPFNSCGNGLTSNAFSVTVSSAGAASVSIGAVPSGTICSGTNVTFTATPINGGTPSYQWKKNNINVGTNSVSYSDNGLNNFDQITCVMTSSTSCVSGSPATSNFITMNVNASVTPLVSIALTTGTNPQCSGASATFTATPTNGGTTPTYQWKVSNVNAGTNSPTFTTSTLTNGQVITCVMTSNLACASPATATSSGITMTVNSNISSLVSIALTSGTDPSCAGTSLTFTATPTNGGASPSYQWKVDGGNVGTDNASFTTTTLTNGQVVTCEMTSNADCVTGNPAASNTISIVVNVIQAINSFAPLTGNVGTQVIISGSGFNNVTSVDFNGVASTFVINNDNQITATVPPGSVDGLIGVTTSCGTQYSSGSFTSAGAVTVNVKLFIEGFYLGGGQMTGVLSPTVCDSVDVSLATGVSPYTILYTVEGTIDISGEGSFIFPSGVSGNSYYIVVKHRNTLETWSDVAVIFNSSVVTFDFTTSGSKAFGSNMIEMDGQFAIRSGDVNQDGIIDADDLFSIETSELLFLTGYVPQDLTGDYIVESADYSIVENNLSRVMARP